MITIVVMMQLLSFNFWSLLGWESFIIFRPHTFSQDLDTHRCCYKFFIFSQKNSCMHDFLFNFHVSSWNQYFDIKMITIYRLCLSAQYLLDTLYCVCWTSLTRRYQDRIRTQAYKLSHITSKSINPY